MSLPRIIIADNSLEFGQVYRDTLNKQGFSAALLEKDGAQLVKCIKETRPDVVIMDAYMKHLSAVDVIRLLLADPQIERPGLIVTSLHDDSAFENKEDIRFIRDHADFFLQGYFSLQLLTDAVNKLTELTRAANKMEISEAKKPKPVSNLERLVSMLLRDLRMPMVNGYYFIKDAVALHVVSGRKMVTKELYPMLATKNKKTWKAIERAMRYAIDCTWDSGNIIRLKELFGEEKPCNSAFISILAEEIIMKYPDRYQA